MRIRARDPYRSDLSANEAFAFKVYKIPPNVRIRCKQNRFIPSIAKLILVKMVKTKGGAHALTNRAKEPKFHRPFKRRGGPVEGAD